MGPRRAAYDLHLHTEWSYDALTPVQEVFRTARDCGVTTIAITDHHVIDAIPEALAVSARYGDLRYIVAAELTVTTSIGAVDLVCLGLPAEPTGQLAEVLDEYHDWQRRQGAWMIEGMKRLGLEYSGAEHDELLASYRPRKAISLQGRTHIKNEVWRDYLKGRGHVASDDDYRPFMQRLSSRYSPPPEYPAADRVTSAVKLAGGLIIIAHPVGYFQRDNRERMDTLARECRLDGIECAHASVPPELTPVYRSYCVEHGLVSSAGSDAHTPETLREGIGLHRGEPAWLDEITERLGG